MIDDLICFVRDQYRTKDFIPLHAPIFRGREREMVLDTIESTFVSSVGAYVDRFEMDMASFTGSPRAVAVVNGTAGLHTALKLAGVSQGDLVVTQSLTFVATCNAIAYCGADALFVDVDKDTLGMSPTALEAWLSEHAFIDDEGNCRTREGHRRIKSCIPMHTFGHPVDLDALIIVCKRWNLFLIEDAAESLGSYYKNQHTGTLGQIGVLSFNGNKIMTTGGGGMLLTNDIFGKKAKHLTTTAKIPHPYEFFHDEIGYNYRLPNLNAALGCAQLEQLPFFLKAKRELASRYIDFFRGIGLQPIVEPEGCCSNYWLNGVICSDIEQRNVLLKATNDAGVMTRPIWMLMNRLPQFESTIMGPLPNSEWLAERVVNLPSSVPQY
ncbi:LegC family aminotransferase [Chromobacterium haemolyticum]|uniref:LegC family aminotransferase n=1 Tax=Chromobacterium haemolyticum TaxID=394935 RepID=UPI0009DAD882|nr:LegC family aminotransferase [Chromobacterium haemolyticum]OQS42497.1 aminotransferase DegT [Chromobacterium haemolyticum]